ncbi:bifunctional Sin3 associated polypeptide p18/Sin3 associated polypeptide p18 superfamily [Babesia duncani]|uniref:Bifunctional Sin3 associated polypeptide p18/Sin3 associated polypeptide p18 superfamily n=1 Tax=Babesia duncani TaxID=323732 RepID=A0AAD9UNG2_9APIC|nr:bifunctional Sin3 associated polypeptide p18/Sin3 associated polypeptide p18 superfamily [Babesia duncani]
MSLSRSVSLQKSSHSIQKRSKTPQSRPYKRRSNSSFSRGSSCRSWSRSLGSSRSYSTSRSYRSKSYTSGSSWRSDSLPRRRRRSTSSSSVDEDRRGNRYNGERRMHKGIRSKILPKTSSIPHRNRNRHDARPVAVNADVNYPKRHHERNRGHVSKTQNANFVPIARNREFHLKSKRDIPLREGKRDAIKKRISKIDRDLNTPFLLRIFANFNHEQMQEVKNTDDELQVYLWPNSNLRDLVNLVKDTCPRSRLEKGKWIFQRLAEGKIKEELAQLHSFVPSRTDHTKLNQLGFTIGDSIYLTFV